MTRAEIDGLYPRMHVKDQVLGNIFGGTFQTSDRISHCIHIVRASCCQLPTRSGIVCLLIKIVYWPCDLKFMYPMINLAFLEIIVKLNFLWNFACTALKVFLFPNKPWCKIFFPLLSKALWSRINNCYSILF